MSESKRGGGALLAGGAAAILSSTCCLGPLALVALGFSGTWISLLTGLEPYRPIFLGASLVALFFAGRQIWRPARGCGPQRICAMPRAKRIYRRLFWFVTLLVIVAFAYPLVLPFFY